MTWTTVWRFDTKRFTVALQMTPDDDLDLSWDETGETQDKLASGEYTAFGSRVVVYCDGQQVGSDSLWGSVYAEPREFWTAHRDPDPMHRNCSLMRKVRGNITYCHYFPEMVRIAIGNARMNIANHPRLRRTAGRKEQTA